MLADPTERTTKKSPIVADLLSRYADYLRIKVSERWLPPYRYPVRRLMQWLTSRKLALSDFTPELANEFFRSRKSLGLHSLALKDEFIKIRRFLRFAKQEGLIAHDPSPDVSCRWLNVPGGYSANKGALAIALPFKPAHLFKYRLPRFCPDWEAFLRHLTDQKYKRNVIKAIARKNRDFYRYALARNIRGTRHIKPAHLDGFVRWAHRRYRRRHGRLPSQRFDDHARWAVQSFLRFAFARRGRVFGKPKRRSASKALPDSLLRQYVDYCRRHKGLSTETLRRHVYLVTRLRKFLGHRRIASVAAAGLGDYDKFLMTLSKTLTPRAMSSPIGALRSFLRFLFLEGILPADLSAEMMSPCRFSADTRPKYLPWRKIEQLFESIERDTLVGKRDYAILTLLACHGLRAGEAAKLRLSDIDWNEASMLLRDQKNGSTSKIPLSSRARTALEDYLQSRQSCEHPEVFLTVAAPLRPLGAGVRAVAASRLKERFGRIMPIQGAHVLRHSFAKLLLDRKARIEDVRLMLRQRSPNSTQAYTRIATEELREVADNYANLFVSAPAEPPAQSGASS